MTAASELVAFCGGQLCKDGMEGRCPGHPKADHEYTPDIPPMDPQSFDRWTTDEFDAAGGFFLTAWRAHMLRLQEERDRFFTLWREAEAKLAERGEGAA